MVPGEIFLANFPFGDTPGMKLRPVLALSGALGPIPEVLVAYISSVIPTILLESDLLFDPATSADQALGLRALSVMRLHKVATIHQSSLQRRLGRLGPERWKDVQQRLRTLLDL